MPLSDHVSVARRFQKSIRLDTDLASPFSLEGFICPRSSADVLDMMATHLAEHGQGAFTWTGPYGSGKSSLAVALSALLSGDEERRRMAISAFGADTAGIVRRAMPVTEQGWHVLPVVGERAKSEDLFGAALRETRIRGISRRRTWDRKAVFGALAKMAHERDGLLVFVDEMGKVLEGAARDGHDIHFFQELAELASRSDGRLVVVGILHQAFDEYAHRLAREIRDEWAKIQGRFVDLAVNAAADEQISLLGRAIQNDGTRPNLNGIYEDVARLTKRGDTVALQVLLRDCWPLHPVVASLLGPISRRRFGQNQRSLFGFLNSSEPRGFQEFLQGAESNEVYAPDQLWDYLRLNLEPSIMASPDGHRWSVATDAVERCHAYGGDEVDLKVLKTLALIGMFQERSGLVASPELLERVFGDGSSGSLTKLRDWSLVIYRRFNNSYSVFEGSDFDIDREVEGVLQGMDEPDLKRLNQVAGLDPIVAKRHYHETGAMRWFDLSIAPLDHIVANPESFRPSAESMGAFLLAMPARGETYEESSQKAREAVEQAEDWDLVVGLSAEVWNFNTLVKELLALEQVANGSPELQGDAVARRELEIRLSGLRGQVEAELAAAFSEASWQAKELPAERLDGVGLNQLASELAGRRFPRSPVIANELLNRSKPSSNAVAAQNYLLHRMVNREMDARLGIDGFPAEGGLYASILEKACIHVRTGDGWSFAIPGGDNDPCKVGELFEAAEECLRVHQDRTVTLAEIYEVWAAPPFGVKNGLLTVLGAAFVLAERHRVAFYRQGSFQPKITDLDMDVLAKSPGDIQLRWMSLTQASRDLLSQMAGIVRELDHNNALTDLTPINVARGLVSIYDRLPDWVERTQRLSSNAMRVRHLFKMASDPNRLIFDDIPELLATGGSVNGPGDQVLDGLTELQRAYPEMLGRLGSTLLGELQVPNTSAAMLAELRDRAQNVRDLAGNLRLEAFVIRLCEFDGSDGDIESIASMAVNKPPRTWVDSDIDRATVEIAELAGRFLRVESLAHVKGRRDKRHAMAVTVGLAGRPVTMQREFEVTARERGEVEGLISSLEEALGKCQGAKSNVVLAALAEVSKAYLEESEGWVRRHENEN